MNRTTSQNSKPVSAEAIQNWLVAEIARELEMEPQQIDRRRPLGDFGLESSTVVILSVGLEEFLGRRVDPELWWESPTIESLAQRLAKMSESV